MSRIIAALLVAIALVAAGCSSDDDAATDPDPTGETTGNAGAMSDAINEIRQRASDALDASEESIQIDGPQPLDGSSCVLYGAWDPESTNPSPLQFAVLPDDSVIQGLTDDAARRTLDGCFFDLGAEPNADAVAEVVLRLAAAPGPIGLLDEVTGRRELEPLGIEWEPPTASGSVADGDFAVRYFARDLEVGIVMAATVSRSPDGSLDIEYQDL